MDEINCFETETDREEQKGTYGSHFQIKKNKQKAIDYSSHGQKVGQR